jgi:conjugative transfer signal peptidase TraF
MVRASDVLVHVHTRREKEVKAHWISASAAGILAAVAGLVFDPDARLFWNRTGSAPIGLYGLSDNPFTRGDWVIVSARSGEADWAAARGYVGRDWPLIKRIAALPGDEICREGSAVLVEGIHVAEALDADTLGRAMPVWEGCQVLGRGEVFLLNQHPRSVDGRYFGPTKVGDLGGVLVLLWSPHGRTADISGQGDAGRGQEFCGESGRARLKLRRHPMGSALSAHLFLRRLLHSIVAPLFSHRFEFIEPWRRPVCF